jgi:superfamily II DNA or RNA helicase/HKD family nuclease
MSDFNTNLTAGVIAGLIDENSNCIRRDLMPTFLSNNGNNGKKVLSNIHFELEHCDEFWFSVAFVTKCGVAVILEVLKELQDRGIPGKILVSKYQNCTEPEALRTLLQFKNIQLRISEGTNFHAKAYIFRNKNGYNVIIGSSNLTAAALSTNREWNVKFSSTYYGKLVIDTLREFRSEFEHATLVDNAFISKYSEEYVEQKSKTGFILQQSGNGVRTISPNSMQLAALGNLEMLRKNGKARALLISATGTGKTFLSAFDVSKFKPKRFLFIVHRLTIAKEAMNSFKKILGSSISMGLFSGNSRELNSEYIFSTVQTISRRENYQLFDREEFDYIVIDETHRSGAESYVEIMNYFKPKFLLGMTATPERTDGFDIFKQFHYNIAFEIRLNKALEQNMLCPFHYYGVTDVSVNGQLIEEEAGFNLLVSEERVKKIIENIEFYGCDDGVVRGLVFLRNIEECKALSAKFNERGYRTVALTGESTAQQREDAIGKLESASIENKLDYIFSVDIFNEGVDIPRVNQIVLLRPTQSAIIFVQQLGRGLRKKDGKSHLTVIDFIGNYSNNFLIPIALFGDNSYDRETLRKLVSSGSSLIPGESTVNFERIAKEKIYESINRGSWEKHKDFVNDFQLLKFRLGRDPMMYDFVESNSRDPFQYVEHYKSYFNFLLKYSFEVYGGLLSEKESKCIELFSKEVLNGVRYHEILLLQMLIDNESISFVDFDLQLYKALGVRCKSETWISVLNNLNFLFVREKNLGKLVPVGMKYKFTLVIDTLDKVEVSRQLKKFLDNAFFQRSVRDLLKTAASAYLRKFGSTNYNTGFLLYERYSRKDVFRILNWKENPVAQNVGGYMISSNKDDLAIFVTYHKSKKISKSIQYEEKFISQSVFEWMSKNSRNLNSPEIRALQTELNMRIPLFVKKSDKEGDEFYYMGDMKPIGDSFTPSRITNDKGKKVSVVQVQFIVTPSVDDSIYKYLITEEGIDQKKKHRK